MPTSDRKTVYDGARGLADLPWFEMGSDGRLRLVDDSVGPIVDVHTHLALTYVRRESVDLRAEHPRTEHYLPVDCTWDLDVYANRNFSAPDLSRMKRDLGLGSVTKGGMRRTHTMPNLLREMDDLGIARSVLLPIELPMISRNAEHWLDVVADEPALVCLGSVHPISRDPGSRLEAQKAMGARGIKLHPAVQMMPADHKKMMAVYRICADLDLPVLWHCGPVGIEPALGRYCSQVKHHWRAVRENPDTKFVLGHSGALQMDQALELAQTYDNAFLEVASQGVGNVRRLVEEAPADRVMFGTDWPFYHQGMGLAKVLIATEDRLEQRARVLWDNAAAVFGLEA